MYRLTFNDGSPEITVAVAWLSEDADTVELRDENDNVIKTVDLSTVVTSDKVEE